MDPDSPNSNSPPRVSGELRARGQALSSAALLLPRICPLCDERFPADFKVCPRDAVRLEDVEEGDTDPLIGSVLGTSYRVVRAIGEGGTARVYEARHVRLSAKRFAVKVLHSVYAAQATLVTRFQREAEAAAMIAHPNVVDVYDVDCTADGRPYIVTEFLEGQDLGSLLKERGKLDLELALHVCQEICRALAAAHERGIVHRDMKPENVFVSFGADATQIKVLDFGISKILEGDAQSLTRTGVIVGTPAFMSPEQAAGRAVDGRTDIYATGAILYRALTGRLPFEGDTSTEILSAVIGGNAPRPRALEASIPDAVEVVIQRAMAAAPEERFGSMRELEAELIALSSPEPEAELTAGTPPPVSAKLRRTQPTLTEQSALMRSGSGRGQEARFARPMIILTSLALCLFSLACLAEPIALWLGRGGASGGDGTSRLFGVMTGLAVVATGPSAVWVLYLARVWKNTVRSLELATLLRRLTVAMVATYATCALAMRLLALTNVMELTGLLPSALLALSTIAAQALTVYLQRRKMQTKKA